MSIGLLILGLLLFVMLVVVHEFGHFILARRNGVEIEEFGIFFPPRLWKKKTKNGWDFTVNLIPLGGFVRLKGESDSARGKGTFGSARLGVKAKIMLAGVGMNLLAAFVLLMVLAWIGMPQLVPNQFAIKSDSKLTQNELLVGQVQAGSPAAKVGLRADDNIIGITGADGQKRTVNGTSGLSNSVTKSYAGQTVAITYVRDKQTYTKRVTLRSVATVTAANNKPACTQNGNCLGYLGIEPTSYQVARSTWSAPVTAAGTMAQVTALTFKGLGNAVGGLASTVAGSVTGNHTAREHGQTSATSEVTGPIGIFAILKTGTLFGYQFILMVIAIISLSLAIMNILPIPALDGGKLFLTLVARAFRKTLTETAEAAIYGTSFALLIALVILISIVDVHRYY